MALSVHGAGYSRIAPLSGLVAAIDEGPYDRNVSADSIELREARIPAMRTCASGG